MQNLVEITQKKHGVILDLQYATKDNICQTKMYQTPRCFLHKTAEEKLVTAINLAKKHRLNFKIFDGFRPLQIQEFMYNKFPGEFVSNPKTGAIPHCRGVAIDLTLINESDNSELEMGSDFDEFSDLAFHGCQKISPQATKNRQLLFDIMEKSGWDFYQKEWWHYQLFNPRNYEIISKKWF